MSTKPGAGQAASFTAKKTAEFKARSRWKATTAGDNQLAAGHSGLINKLYDCRRLIRDASDAVGPGTIIPLPRLCLLPASLAPMNYPETTMKRSLMLALAVTLVGSAAQAASMMTSVPSSSKTVSDWYKQDVYDPSQSSIGKIDDVLVSDSGQISALVIGVGGFLGAGEKDVAVPFRAVKWTTKDKKNYLTLDATKDQLKSAQGLKYDSDKTAWVPDKK